MCGDIKRPKVFLKANLSKGDNWGPCNCWHLSLWSLLLC